ncbi:hypothetical protein P8452_30801 [Trifolium repens]|nr:hypothetical protein P8452_30801 [Trifolium repens]
MSFLSVLVLFLAVISLTITNIEGNPKQQIHAQSNGLISGPNSRRSLTQDPSRPPSRPPPRTPSIPVPQPPAENPTIPIPQPPPITPSEPPEDTTVT